MFEQSAAWFIQLQEEILSTLEELEGGKRFLVDDWARPEVDPAKATGPLLGGGGRTRVLENGRVFDKAGVNFSQVHGRFSEEFAASLPGEGLDFKACGVSLVIHPVNPWVPTVHMNYRRLSRGTTGWFGGGADMTPYYVNEAEITHFHQAHKDACDRHAEIADFSKLKKACDEYFHLPHRQEARGVGGIFFDYMFDKPDETFAFVKDSGRAFLKSWLPIAKANMDRPYTAEEKEWQKVRRGRYVEFNLIHDRGTIFGLKTGGRTESILMSLPNEVSWRYMHTPAEESPEGQLLSLLKSPKDWV